MKYWGDDQQDAAAALPPNSTTTPPSMIHKPQQQQQQQSVVEQHLERIYRNSSTRSTVSELSIPKELRSSTTKEEEDEMGKSSGRRDEIEHKSLLRRVKSKLKKRKSKRAAKKEKKLSEVELLRGKLTEGTELIKELERVLVLQSKTIKDMREELSMYRLQADERSYYTATTASNTENSSFYNDDHHSGRWIGGGGGGDLPRIIDSEPYHQDENDSYIQRSVSDHGSYRRNSIDEYHHNHNCRSINRHMPRSVTYSGLGYTPKHHYIRTDSSVHRRNNHRPPPHHQFHNHHHDRERNIYETIACEHGSIIQSRSMDESEAASLHPTTSSRSNSTPPRHHHHPIIGNGNNNNVDDRSYISNREDNRRPPIRRSSSSISSSPQSVYNRRRRKNMYTNRNSLSSSSSSSQQQNNDNDSKRLHLRCNVDPSIAPTRQLSNNSKSRSGDTYRQGERRRVPQYDHRRNNGQRRE